MFGPLKLDEFHYAEIQWIINAQKVFVENNKYSKELKATLGIYFEDQVLRCGGRLNKSKLLDNARNPILLPKDGHVTTLIIKNAHEKVKHGGIKDTLTEVRSRFWVLQGRSAVSKVIKNCTSPCNRLESKPFKSPIAPDLPEGRVCFSYP